MTDGHHPGDTVNVYAHADGTANADQYTVDATLGDATVSGGPTTLFDADGSAIIVHEGPDSYGEAPGAGARIACGVIVPRLTRLPLARRNAPFPSPPAHAGGDVAERQRGPTSQSHLTGCPTFNPLDSLKLH